MKKNVFLLLAISAIVLIAAMVVADVHSASYKGTKLCMMCHKATHPTIVKGFQKSAHFKAMQNAADENAIVGDFSTNTAFKKDQVAFVLGSGRTEQAYLDAKFQVLPATWDVKSKTWKPAQAVDGSTQCIGCHVTGYNADTKAYTNLGVGCESCHGPGSEHVASPKTVTPVKPKNLTPALSAMICGSCHSVGKDPTGKYAFPVGYRPGDDLTKFFVDAKPTMPGRNQQYSDWITSKHAKANVTCETCHNPHNEDLNADDTSKYPHQLRKPINDQCLGCHAAKVKDLATHAPNAPAGATCATCHMPDGRHMFTEPGS
jgi:predicted CXXCH cytochrome family protein